MAVVTVLLLENTGGLGFSKRKLSDVYGEFNNALEISRIAAIKVKYVRSHAIASSA